jgi:hypothetical protein
MPTAHRWNHVNLAVPPERIARIAECIDELFGWDKFVAKSYLVGYRLCDDLNAAALYLRPAPTAGAVLAELERMRESEPAVARALEALASIEGDWVDHVGFMTGSLAEWEERLGRAQRMQRDRPELEVQVVDVLRPGDGRAQTDYLYQAFIRLGLLGPLRNTFEMQAVEQPS